VRNALITQIGCKLRFEAVFSRFDAAGHGKVEPKGLFLMLTSRCGTRFYADHVYLHGLSQRHRELLQHGDRVRFTAVPHAYSDTKAYLEGDVVKYGACTDINLITPSAVSVVDNVLANYPDFFYKYRQGLLSEFNHRDDSERLTHKFSAVTKGTVDHQEACRVAGIERSGAKKSVETARRTHGAVCD